MRRLAWATLPALALTAIGVHVAAQNITAPVQIIDASSTIPQGDRRFPLAQIRDGFTEDNGRNGFVGKTGALGSITLTLDKYYDIEQFHIWNDISVRAEGVENFTLLLYTDRQLVHTQTFSGRFAVRAGVKSVQTVNLSRTAAKVNRVEFRVDTILDRPNTYARRVEVREVALSGIPWVPKSPPSPTPTPSPVPTSSPTPSPSPTEELEIVAEEEIEDPFSDLIMRDRDIPEFEPNMVLFFSREPSASLRTIAADNGLLVQAITELDQIGLTMVSARIEPGDLVEDAVKRLRAYKVVEWAEPNAYYQLLENSRSGGLDMHGLGQIEGGAGKTLPNDATIVLIDSPIDTENAALQGARIEQKAVDVADTPSPHGTAIAELLVGTGEFAGVAKGARLVSFAAFEETDANGFLSTSETLAKALNAASRMRPHALNLSFGSNYDSKVLTELLDVINGHGICVATAAGNGEGAPVLFPARHASTLAITALDRSRRPYAYASVGNEIDVAAWGVAMNAAVPGGRRVVSGTSFATALVSGGMLYMPACTDGRDPAAMRTAIKGDAEDLGDKGEDPIYGAGLFRLGVASTTAVKHSNAPPPAEELPDLEEGTNPLIYAAGGAGALGAGGLFFLAWRRRKKKAEAS